MPTPQEATLAPAFLKILAQELAWVHSCNAFSGCVKSEVTSGHFLISADTLRSPSQRLISALNRAKVTEIRGVEELHPHCSPSLTPAFASQLSVRLLEETNLNCGLKQREIHIKTPGKMSEHDSER